MGTGNTPCPELTDADMKLINQSLNQFLNYFGGTESLSSTSELDPTACSSSVRWRRSG